MLSGDYFSSFPMKADGNHRRGRGDAVTWIRSVGWSLCRSRADEGQSLLETALAALVFFFLMFAVFDFGRLFFVEIDVQNAIQQAARYGSTGNHLADPNSPGNSLSRVASIVNTLEKNAWGVKLSNIQVSSLNGGSGSAGGPGDMLTVSTTANMPLMTPVIAHMFPNGQFTFTASITVRNEPFAPGQTK